MKRRRSRADLALSTSRCHRFEWAERRRRRRRRRGRWALEVHRGQGKPRILRFCQVGRPELEIFDTASVASRATIRTSDAAPRPSRGPTRPHLKAQQMSKVQVVVKTAEAVSFSQPEVAQTRETRARRDTDRRIAPGIFLNPRTRGRADARDARATRYSRDATRIAASPRGYPRRDPNSPSRRRSTRWANASAS